MSEKKRGLGKGLGDLGLSALLGDIHSTVANFTVENPASAVVKKTQTDLDLRHLAVDLIVPGRYQPRKVFNLEDLQDLANSIKAQGIIQPVVVRRINAKQYELIAGERRWRAAQLAGLAEVPAIIREVPDSAAIAMALIENIQRRDLNVMEEAEALNRLILEFQMTHQEVAEAVGKSRTVVTNLLRLLKLNPDVRALVEQNKLEMGHARALLVLEGAKQSELAQIIVLRQLSVRQVEELVRQFLDKNANTPKVHKVDPDILSLQKKLGEKLGAEVKIQHLPNGHGKLMIHYNSSDELEGILAHIL